MSPSVRGSPIDDENLPQYDCSGPHDVQQRVTRIPPPNIADPLLFDQLSRHLHILCHIWDHIRIHSELDATA